MILLFVTVLVCLGGTGAWWTLKREHERHLWAIADFRRRAQASIDYASTLDPYFPQEANYHRHLAHLYMQYADLLEGETID